jgi:hypothetical protein
LPPVLLPLFERFGEAQGSPENLDGKEAAAAVSQQVQARLNWLWQ